MLTGRGSLTARLMLLVVGINAVALAAWIELTSVTGVRVTPGFAPVYRAVSGDGWAWGLGSAIVWLALFSAAGILVAGRVLLMQWMLPAPASARRLAVVERARSAKLP